MRALPLFLLLATACKTTARPTLTEPATAPVPTPATSTPPPSTVLPDDSTALVDIPRADWPGICAALAEASAPRELVCPGIGTFDIEGVTRSEAESACVASYQDSADVDGCLATFSDLVWVYDNEFDCDWLESQPLESQRLGTCYTAPPTHLPGGCEIVSGAYPADQAPSTYVGTTLSWTFSDVDTTVAVQLTQAGSPVAGTGEWLGTTYVWTPAATLASSTSYQSTLTWCDDDESATSTFTTSATGATAPTGSLEGTAYAIDFADPSVQWLEPPGVGALLAAQLEGLLVVGVQSVNGSTVELMFAGRTGLDQDLCVETESASGDFSNPFFSDVETDLPILGVPIGPLDFNGAFSPDGTTLVSSLQGSIDTRLLVPLLSPGQGDDAVCVLMSQFGLQCETCAGGGDFCIGLHAVNLPAEEVSGLVLVERTSQDIADDFSCP